MSDRPCTPEQAQAALDYLRHAFGGYAIPDAEQRAHLVVFKSYPPSTIRAAIDKLVLKADRRPSPHDIAQAARGPAVRDTRNPEPLPEVEARSVKAHLDAIRAQVPSADTSRRPKAGAR